MKKYLLTAFLLLLPFGLMGQVAGYEVINAHFQERSDTIFIRPTFIQNFSWSKLNLLALEVTFKDAWAPLPHPEIPSKDAFMDDLDFERYVQFLKDRKITSVDFDQLSDKIQAVDSSQVLLLRKKGVSIYSVSEPYITANKKWAIFIEHIDSNFVSPFRELLIYRKCDSTWRKYHNIQLLY